mmetsp:Transcript_15661/g.31198  ORF Transcript_15661/g.31198 Transcript_15661/m.31198 type:complete len:121 (-) Transcript_15661:6-368(-)
MMNHAIPLASNAPTPMGNSNTAGPPKIFRAISLATAETSTAFRGDSGDAAERVERTKAVDAGLVGARRLNLGAYPASDRGTNESTGEVRRMRMGRRSRIQRTAAARGGAIVNVVEGSGID